jgi:probable rRNA maturation factor
MSSIRFFEEKKGFKLKEKLKIKSWIKKIVASEKREIEDLNYIFVDDEGLYQINLEYLSHDDYTDIITFDLGEDINGKIEGEIYISIDRVRENAAALAQEENRELKRVIAHGVLHLCGYKDKTKEEKKEMRNKENKSLDLWDEMFHVEH